MSTSAQPRIDLESVKVRLGGETSFQENYNQRPFGFSHNLSAHPLFQRPLLTELVDRIARQYPERLYYTVGRLGIRGGWNYAPPEDFSAQEAVERIETTEAWIILQGVQVVPDYHRLLGQILREIHAVSGRNLEETKTWNLSIIISSPNRVTPYHMDGDCNYLLQLQGAKTAYVFNGNDRSVVTARELEKYWRGDISAAQYKQASQESAWRFELKPGTGIHIPVTFPHWVQNDNNVSISASINFCLVDEMVADIHRINHYLRKLGIDPRQPGQSALSDAAKKLAANTFRTVAMWSRHQGK